LPVLAVVLAAFGRPDLWVVERIRVEGSDRATLPALRHLMDVPNGTHVLAVSAESVARGVERHPWVRSAQVFWEWPATLVVRVQEHQPAAILAGTPMRYVDQSGEVFAIVTSDDVDYPVISGISPDLEQQHPELPGRVVAAARDLIRELAASGVVHADQISEVQFSATRGFTVFLRGGAQVLFDLDGFDLQVGRLGQLAREGVRLDRPTHIDVALPDMAIVRPLGATVIPNGREVPGGEG
jgi:hypothetical protein